MNFEHNQMNTGQIQIINYLTFNTFYCWDTEEVHQAWFTCQEQERKSVDVAYYLDQKSADWKEEG